MADRNEVLRSYATFVARLWEDDKLLDRVQADPRGVLAAYGLEIPADAKINLLVREMKVDGSPNTQVDLWEQGATTGEYNVIIPLKPVGLDSLEDIPLSEEILDVVSGGGCCCPCTSCPCCWSLEVQ